MAVTPAELRRAARRRPTVFVPYATEMPPLADHDYVQEEWIATGVEDGHPYATTVCVRRPRDRARFSGTVIAEPLHVHGIAPDLDLHRPLPPAVRARVGGDHRAEDDARHAREAVEPAALRGPRHRRTRHRGLRPRPAPRRPRVRQPPSGPS